MSQYTCQFCYQRTTLGYIKNYFPSEINLHKTIKHTLYHKYATSQNYYYTKDINEILSRVCSSRTIIYQDQLIYDEEDEYLKRFYEIHEYSHKSKLLTEFYKFHKDLPRWIVKQQILKILNYYYDKRRKIDFYKIQRQIEHENQMNPSEPPKAIVGEKPLLSDSTPQSESSEQQSKVNVENILKEISFSNKKLHNSKDISRISQVPESPIGDIQHMISLLCHKIESPEQKQQYQFQRKRGQIKKQLKLDELALSVSSRTHQNPQEAKMPLSARYQQNCSNKLIDQIQARLKNKHSSTFSRERLQENQVFKEIKKQQKPDEIYKKTSSPKRLENQKAIQEIKQLELKIIKGLQDIKHSKQSCHSNDGQKIQINIKNKETNLIQEEHNKKQQIKQDNQLNNNLKKDEVLLKQKIDKNQNIKQYISNRTNTIDSTHKSIQGLDLKKLMGGQFKDNAPKTERIKKTIPTLNLNMIGTVNQSTSVTTRNTSYIPLQTYAQILTPKPGSNQKQFQLQTNNQSNK